MKFITYLCPYSDGYFKGALMKADDVFYHVADPLFSLWLDHLQNIETDDLVFRTYLKHSDFLYFEIPNFSDIFTKDELELAFRYPLENRSHMHAISHLFENFFRQRKLDFVHRLEQVVLIGENMLPEFELKKLIAYLIGLYSDSHSRLRLLFSAKVQPYLGGERL